MHRWEQLQSAGGGHVRLPTAARPGCGLNGPHHNGGFRRSSLQVPLPTIPSGDPAPPEQQSTQLAQHGPQHAVQPEQQQAVQLEMVQQQAQQPEQAQHSASAASLPSQAAQQQQQVRQGSDSPPPTPTPEQAPQPGRQLQQ